MNLLLLRGRWSLVREQNCNIPTKGSKLPLLSFASPSVVTTPGGKVSSGSCGFLFKMLGCYRNKASLAEVILVQIYPCGTLWYQASNKVPQKTEQISLSLPFFSLSSHLSLAVHWSKPAVHMGELQPGGQQAKEPLCQCYCLRPLESCSHPRGR